MVDETQSSGGSAASVCPWCSATYEGNPDDCPSCGATLTGDSATDAALPGLTAVDAAAIVRAKTDVPRSRSRLLSWISGDYPDEAASPAEAGALAPPDVEVRREILRLALEAEVANLQADAAADSIIDDIKAVETGIDAVPVTHDATPAPSPATPTDAIDATESAPPA